MNGNHTMSDVPNASQVPSTRQHIAWDDLIAKPWRNGGGITREILSRRRHANLLWAPTVRDDWDWRLSIADIDAPGPFSNFSGMTRILTVIEGASIALTIDGETLTLGRHQPVEFDGASVTSAELPTGPIRDLNLIARTGIVGASVSVESLSIGRPRVMSASHVCVLLNGVANFRTGVLEGAEVALKQYDTVLGSAQHPPTVEGNGIIAVVTIHAVS